MEPNTVFEAITGVPAPRDEAVVAEPMNMENAGAACDFCPNGPLVGIESPPVVWAFPAGQAEDSRELVPGSGIKIGLPFAAMLWKACERCRRHIKANRWADLARDCGLPEGGFGAWQGFRVARRPGPGYAWPLVPHKLPTVHKHVRDAWEKGKLAFADHVRERLVPTRMKASCGFAGRVRATRTRRSTRPFARARPRRHRQDFEMRDSRTLDRESATGAWKKAISSALSEIAAARCCSVSTSARPSSGGRNSPVVSASCGTSDSRRLLVSSTIRQITGIARRIRQ